MPQQAQGVVVFTLIRGGPAEDAYDMFVNSRRCLRSAIMSAVQYDDLAFHEGNVPHEMQLMLGQNV